MTVENNKMFLEASLNHQNNNNIHRALSFQLYFFFITSQLEQVHISKGHDIRAIPLCFVIIFRHTFLFPNLCYLMYFEMYLF
jgi:hypothetical protein